MDRPPVTTVDNQIMHDRWPCIPHPATQTCIVAQQVALARKHAIKLPYRRLPPDATAEDPGQSLLAQR